MSTGSAQISNLVIVVSRVAHLLALSTAGGTNTLSNTLNTQDSWATDTFTLGRIKVKLANRTLGAHTLVSVEEGAWGTRDTLVVNDNLSRVAAEALSEAD
jgi:hypothetical protein